MINLDSLVRASVLCWALCLSGCGHDRSTPGTTPGELGHGAFTYVCTDDSDPVCPNGKSPATFPERVGEGSTFDVEFKPFDHNDLSRFAIKAAAPGVLEERNQDYFAKAPGVVALLAKRTSDGHVLDFVHVGVVAVDSLRLESNGSAPRLTWQTGKAETLQAVALDDQGSPLAGARQFEWTTSDSSVVRLELANPSLSMELTPIAPGAVTISVTSGGVTASLSITVEGKPIEQLDGGTPDGGASLPDSGKADSAVAAPDGGSLPDASPAEGGLTEGGAG